MREIKQHLDNCMDVMEGLFQSGFMAVSEDMLIKLDRLSGVSEQCGLLKLSEYMTELYEKISNMKHQMKRSKEDEKEILKLFCEIRRYLELGLMKTGYDEAKNELIGKEVF